MVRKLLPCLLISACAATENLYFVDDPNFIEKEVVKDELDIISPSAADRFTPITASDYLTNRDSYILSGRTWYTVSFGKTQTTYGSSDDFAKNSFIIDETGLNVVTDNVKEKDKSLSFSIMTRDHSYAYGLSLDYMSGYTTSLNDIEVGSPLASIAGGNPATMESDFIPIIISGRYYFTDGYWLQPFLGAGMGATYQKSRLKLNSIDYSESSWSLWSTVLEAGLTVCLSESYSVDLSLKNYSAQFKSPHVSIKDGSGNALYEFRLKSPLKIVAAKISFNIYSG